MEPKPSIRAFFNRNIFYLIRQPIAFVADHTAWRINRYLKPLLRQELGHIMHRNEGKWKNKWVELPIDGSKGKDFIRHYFDNKFYHSTPRTGCKPDIVLVNEESHHKKRIERNGKLCGINIIEE
ncbi:hypothetical protein RIR_jg3986.t1 [Rhizophagus irregularis DAOM 181602=DAOM 197198]|nr:hypothetical protein RIR_jg3986.t1 [Rhizophagus irregularis DAOM 181602=DAOM 197198]